MEGENERRNERNKGKNMKKEIKWQLNRKKKREVIIKPGKEADEGMTK